MKRAQISRLLNISSRNASTTFRYVESPPPRPVHQHYDTLSPPNSTKVHITVDHDTTKVVSPGKLKMIESPSFQTNDSMGSLKLIPNDSDFFKVMEDPVADKNYFKMFNITQCGFVQLREHIRQILSRMSDENRFILTGNRQCGKTLSCYALLLDAFTSEFGGIIVPGLHISKWFQDTDVTNFVHLKDGVLDFPDFNVEFLRYMMLCNTLASNPDNGILANIPLLDDERWTSKLYSFKGDSLLNVIRTGLTNPPVAHQVIRILISNILHHGIPTRVIVDNANLLSEIHSSKFEGLRENTGVTDEWWNQPKLIPQKITLLESLRYLLQNHEKGHVFLTIDPAREIGDQVIAETGGQEYEHVHIPNTPEEEEYSQFLNILRHFGFLSQDLTAFEVDEFTHLVGRSYPDTFKYIHFF